ncbi:MAG TPA: bifunctional hydroxymethylpyrimidine kinase/phosphomethylpyrimidine kinase [Vicinamibacterales bacterium]|nr:bifunctional hydroxymethylpyrimidine kinase/phosphomethylpyrimidine kinase [Vicinamibacterales bacterium]
MKIALTIAGSDSTGGAGIQADLKTFDALGVYGLSAVTAVTSQSTTRVSDIFTLPPQTVRSQIEQVAQDMEVSAVKTGMLATAEIVRVVAETVGRFQRPNLVVDPVMLATNPGRRILLAPEGVSVLKTRLLPIASVVTPNVAEAAALSGVSVDSIETAREAAKRIFDMGPLAVVITGGHMTGGQAVDLLYYAGAFTEFSAPRSSVGPVHGTGCAFASAVAAGLALGDDVPAAVQRAKDYVTGAIEHSFEAGHGARILNHFWDRGLYS